jgi:ATP-dependent HslUV protease subunit HslV
MTTIAYRDGVMAADSKATYDGSFQGLVTKVFRSPKGDLLGVSGDLALMPIIRDWAKKGCPKPVPNTGDDNSVLWVKPNGTALVVEGGTACEIEGPFFAIGSGHAFAKGAMGAGCDAETAVAVAITLDNSSGGPVKVVSTTST